MPNTETSGPPQRKDNVLFSNVCPVRIWDAPRIRLASVFVQASLSAMGRAKAQLSARRGSSIRSRLPVLSYMRVITPLLLLTSMRYNSFSRRIYASALKASEPGMSGRSTVRTVSRHSME
ncbi:MAG: hypothetical protein BWY09_00962 [Candidatus Hydrogenedentes bacterium ADurb.Bin179]|nr:MAG: hypothetical protein BWY09_00962 [Candidatus Hydrogenedentes bacterium ADurb.Bin179]